MIKKIAGLLLLLILFFACKEEKEHEVIFTNRTVLVYMIADNSLTGNVQANIDSITSGFSTSNEIGNLVIYVDEIGRPPILFKYEKNSLGVVKKRTIRTYPEQNSVSKEIMSGVFREVFKRYPANSYGLVLWSHGMGWIPSPQAKKTRWFGQDDTNYMDIPDLKVALQSAPKFDFILFDACFMCGVEVAYELRKNTKYLIASPTEIWEFGQPYQNSVSAMFTSDGDYTKIARYYAKFYDGRRITNNEGRFFDYTGTIAVIDCDEMDNLAKETHKVFANHQQELLNVRNNNMQRYDRYSYPDGPFVYDYYHFLQKIAPEDELASARAQLDKTIIYKYATDAFGDTSMGRPRLLIKYFSGLGTYIPQLSYSEWNSYYRNFEWFTASGWDKITTFFPIKE
ncbi:MAG: clostripain-related cysteine peptidase [Bacteroidaceae bacterium]